MSLGLHHPVLGRTFSPSQRWSQCAKTRQRRFLEDEWLRQSEWCAMCYAAPLLTRVTVSSSRNAKNNRGEERPSLCLFLFLRLPIGFSLRRWSCGGDSVVLRSIRRWNGAKRRIDMQTEELSGFSLFSFPRRQPYLVQSDELIAFLPKQGSSPNIPVI